MVTGPEKPSNDIPSILPDTIEPLDQHSWRGMFEARSQGQRTEPALSELEGSVRSTRPNPKRKRPIMFP